MRGQIPPLYPPSTSWPKWILCGFSVSVYPKLGASVLSSGSYNIPTSAPVPHPEILKKFDWAGARSSVFLRNLPSYSNKQPGLEIIGLHHITHRVATPHCHIHLSESHGSQVTKIMPSILGDRQGEADAPIPVFSMNVSHIRHSTGRFQTVLTFLFFLFQFSKYLEML